MSTKTKPRPKPPVSDAEMADLREKAKQLRERFKDKPDRDALVSPEDQSNAAPFYFELRAFIHQLKAAREAAGLTLAQLAAKTGLAEETLCRLESGAVTNPTWRTLGVCAAALGLTMSLVAAPSERKRK